MRAIKCGKMYAVCLTSYVNDSLKNILINEYEIFVDVSKCLSLTYNNFRELYKL